MIMYNTASATGPPGVLHGPMSGSGASSAGASAGASASSATPMQGGTATGVTAPGVVPATPVFHHEFLEAATTAVCFCHRFLNPFGGSLALTSTG